MRKSEKTRQYILEKTAPLFNKKGYAGTSLSDITDTTGLTKGSIYGNFSNKDEVALAVYEYSTGLLTGILNRAINEKNTAPDKLIAMTEFYRDHWPGIFGNGGCPMLNAAIEADDGPPFLQTCVQASFANWEKKIVNILETGEKKGEIRQGIVAADYASTIITQIEGGIMLAKITGNTRHLILALDRLVKMIDHELKP
ncbi:TetR/AcrR family transcriptional regulator [Salmonirosea aquatica]|uniref:TetR family transcriptional regulator n=1 Tax=Salmonirosea aquatica TaxID=2654236 RepID=A0A7C9FSU3_9BACT|nr:TetR family transcriptional regulator [Cytophagaceae bacterium SJW1-29]